jgi:hypothetical protein
MCRICINTMAAKKTSELHTNRFTMPCDALEALRADATYPITGELSDIWTLDEVIDAGGADATQVYEFPTIAGLRWDFKSVLLSCSDYMSALAKQFPVAEAILRRMAGLQALRKSALPTLVLFGSAAEWPLGPKQRPPKDFNFAYVGLDSLPAPERWLMIKEATDACLDVLQEMGVDIVRQAMTPGLITLVADWVDLHGSIEPAVDVTQRLHITVDLRAYSSVSALLHTTGHLPIACDGVAAYTTALGAFEHSRRTIVADPIKGTANYENRICHYFQAGYAVTFPYMRPNTFKDVPMVDLGPSCDLQIFLYKVEGMLAFGDLQSQEESIARPTDAKDLGPMASADRITSVRMLIPMFLEHTPLSELNVQAIIEQFADAPVRPAQDIGKMTAGGTWAAVASAASSAALASANYPVRPIPALTEVQAYRLIAWVTARSAITACWVSRKVQGFVSTPASKLPIQRWLERAPTLGEMFPADCRAIITERATACIQALTELGQLDIRGLFNFFKCSAADVTEVAAAAMRTYCAPAGGAREASEARAASVVMAREKAVWNWLERVRNIPVTWWAPHRPLLVESREHWYGESYCAWPRPAPMADRLAAAMAVAAARETPLTGTTYGDTCSLCFEPIRRGELNTVTLKCGHIFHYAGSSCGGLEKWARGCPQCRKH